MAQKTGRGTRKAHAELFRSALETFCVPISVRELEALRAQADGLSPSAQPDLFTLEQDPLELLRRLADQQGYVEDREARQKPAFYKLSVPPKDVPANVLRILGLQRGEVRKVRDSVERMILTSNPAKVIDRAARAANWQVSEQEFPYFQDTDGLKVEYRHADIALSKLNESVLAMDPRTADAWRLITARSLEHWPGDKPEPQSVWVDVRELADVMGYRKKTNGAYNPKSLEKVARGIADLQRMLLKVPIGTMEYPHDPKTGHRRKTRLEAERTVRVLAVMATDQIRDLYGTEYPMRWLVQLGPWVRDYPRQFAPILGNLVELPVKGSDLWAKNIGMELLFHYGERAARGGILPKEQVVLKIQTLLTRAELMGEMEAMRHSRNARRAREYFERAMDTLAERGALAHWAYHPDDEETLGNFERGRNTSLDTWLSLRVVVTPPNLESPPTLN